MSYTIGNWAAVVLAAGEGRRMKSSTPKLLHRVCGREMISLVVESTREAGIGRMVLVVRPGEDALRQLLGSSVEYAEQARPLGTGHALLQAHSILSDVDNLLVTCGDVPLIRSETIARMIALHTEREACLTVLTSDRCPPDGLGRVLRDGSGKVVAVVEERDAAPDVLEVAEVNSGIYCFRGQWLWDRLSRLTPSPKGEIYLTDLVSRAASDGVAIEALVSQDPWEILGVNSRIQLAQAEAAMRQRIRERWMLEGVTLVEPRSVYIDASVELGQDTLIHPNTHIGGRTRIGRDCVVGPNSIVHDSVIGQRCRIVASAVEGSTLEDGVQVGPFSHIRAGSHIERDAYIGNYAEVKKSRLGRGTKMGHFSYVGDAVLGSNVNIGAGTITCNYDGKQKHQTIIGDDAFIGSDSMLVAPIRIGARSVTGAGSVVTKDVPPDSVAVGIPARITARRKDSRSSPR